MAEAGIGSPISEKVVVQINKRRAVIGKQGTKTNTDLNYLLGNTSWIKLSSGVNTLTEEEAKTLSQQKSRTKIVGGNGLAKENILFGGILSANGSIRGGISTSTDTNSQTAYRNNPKSSGIRPMPGITGLSVKSKNTFGTLREAEVQISCWSLEDFELIERIYLRPGFTMLLEWGHSTYLNNDGDLVTTIKTIPPEVFFSNDITYSKLLEDINTLREEGDCNYEAMVGYVKNINWNYTPTGEYQCTLTIISSGEILESLKPRIHPTHRAVSEKDFKKLSGDEETMQTAAKSPIHYFAEIVKIQTRPFQKSKGGTSELIYPSFFSVLEDFPIFYQSVDYSTASGFWGQLFSNDERIATHWIPLSALLEIFTKYLHFVDQTQKSGSVDRYFPKFFYDAEKNPNKYLTFPEHFSIDPGVVVLPKTVQGKYIAKLGKDAHVKNVANNLQKAQFKGGDDNILNILVSVPFVKGIVDGGLDEKSEFTKTSLEIVQEILQEINSALGGINDLDLTFDEDYEGGTYFVVDRNNTPTNGISSPELTLVGIDSIFTDISISSKITNNIASQIAIAAQGSSQNFSENVENILKWNPQVVDRVITTKSTAEESKDGTKAIEEEEKDRVEKWITDVKAYFTAFNGSGWRDDQKQAARTLFNEQMVKYMQSYKKINKEPIPGLIPVELSFKLDGIGRLKIGETFRIAPGILPSKYQSKFGYIITGIEHTVENNSRWSTGITTQFYLIEPTSPDEEEQSTSFEIQQDIKVGAGNSTAPGNTNYTSQSCVDDSKVRISTNWNLAQLSCSAPVVKASIPAPGKTKTHPTYGILTREDIINNLRALSTNVLEPIKQKYPTMFVTNAYRNNGGRSQHEAGMAADIQFTDQNSLTISQQNELLLKYAQGIKQSIGGWDQMLLEYKTTRGGRPWIHISYRIGASRKEASTFLDDKYASRGRDNLYNALV
jgi:zinc D-Ala-D-Ala carboxypeptidase